MGLPPSDKKPANITLNIAYQHIREWYTNHSHLLRERMEDRSYIEDSNALILALPSSETILELEIRAVLGEVIYGNLEWGYHDSDGNFKMAAYAHAALEQAGLTWNLSKEEIEQLKTSSLWPHLMISEDIK